VNLLGRQLAERNIVRTTPTHLWFRLIETVVENSRLCKGSWAHCWRQVQSEMT